MPRFLICALTALSILVAACSPAAQPTPPTAAPTSPAAAKPTTAPAAAATSAPAAGPATKIAMAYSNLIADSLSLWVAKESGIFSKNGLDVDLQYIASSNAFAALLAGQVQASAGGGSEVISGTAGGADVVVVANLMPIYPYFMESPASIQKPADLKGG